MCSRSCGSVLSGVVSYFCSHLEFFSSCLTSSMKSPGTFFVYPRLIKLHHRRSSRHQYRRQLRQSTGQGEHLGKTEVHLNHLHICNSFIGLQVAWDLQPELLKFCIPSTQVLLGDFLLDIKDPHAGMNLGVGEGKHALELLLVCCIPEVRKIVFCVLWPCAYRESKHPWTDAVAEIHPGETST